MPHEGMRVLGNLLSSVLSLTFGPSLHSCFGVIHRPQDSTGYVCLMFAELDSAGPVANVVHYVRHILGISSRT